MRKIIIFLVIITTLIFHVASPIPTVVAAQSPYQRIITEDTPFYSDENGVKLLFYLPYTYYVKVLSEKDGLSHVECYGLGGTAAIDGYVPSSMLFDDGLSVTNPFVILKITTAKTAVLYADAALTEPLQYVFAERELSYYGARNTETENLYYVGYNDRLGYVKESDVVPFLIPNHPNELTFIVPEEPPLKENTENQEQQTENDLSVQTNLRIIIIVCLIFAGIIALFIALKNKPQKSVAAGYYDENDYE